MESLNRRDFLRLGALSSVALLAPRLAWADDTKPGAIIVLWLGGGPSQLETFDPKPGTKIGGPTKSIKTSVDGVEIAMHYPRIAESMKDLALVRSVVTPEGEHERGTYFLRTGYRPSPTVVHPSIGAVFAKELAAPDLDIPAHVAIDPDFGPPRGGLLGAGYDAFQTSDPKHPLPDVAPRVKGERLEERAKDLAVIDGEFARGRAGVAPALEHARLAERAKATMTSPRLKAFDLSEEPKTLVESYGDSAFGRGCLAARRLVQAGVRGIEVTLHGWDSHAANFTTHEKLAGTLDPAFSALVKDLRDKELLETTLVVCLGEFGRTPAINRLEGRDHWTKGFSVLLAGRGIKKGVVLGETDPEGEKAPSDPVGPADLFATIYKACGIDPTKQNTSAAGRPIALSEGKPVARLLA
jgi:hypothetical protein